LNKINKIDEEDVRNIMQNMDSNNVKEILGSDLDKQRDEFQKKLKEKRSRNNNTSDISINITKVNDIENNNNPTNNNENSFIENLQILKEIKKGNE
jgi:hypothetical protein